MRCMGLEITREHFDERDYQRFSQRLDESLDVLASLLKRDDFGTGPSSVGAEIEASLVDASGRPLPINSEVLGDFTEILIPAEVLEPARRTRSRFSRSRRAGTPRSACCLSRRRASSQLPGRVQPTHNGTVLPRPGLRTAGASRVAMINPPCD